MAPRIWPGRPYPLGASYDGIGVNFAVFSEHGSRVDLCLFDRATGESEKHALTLPEQTAHVHHGYVPGLLPGPRCGCRVHGPYAPAGGQPCIPQEMVAGPYARACAKVVDG